MMNQNSVLNNVVSMVSDAEASRIAGKYGLNIQTVSWEDNARTKNSCWGPCISDMTLSVKDKNMPVIRSPNFTDLTWDVEIKKIPIVVGNEKGGQLKTITLKEYLKNFDQYLHHSSEKKINLLRDNKKDSHVIMSSQACFLPMEKGSETNFNVQIYNYQSTTGNPAVLSIVACASGTSATPLEKRTKLYFNKNGKRCPFVGQRLSDNREQRNEDSKDTTMSESEKQQNVLLIIQVPLKHKVVRPTLAFNSMVSMNTLSSCKKNRCRSRKSDVENVIVKIGTEEGDFTELNGLSIERDESFPIRVTLQYYKATSNGVINDDNMKEIYDQIQASRKFATSIGSLVVGNSNRPTEYIKPKPTIPLWWKDFWYTYQSNFPRFTEETAKEFVFKDGRYTDKTMGECESDIIIALTQHPESNLPSWGII